MNKAAYETSVTYQKPASGSFPFMGEVLALDLVNTKILVRGAAFDFFSTPADAAQWWCEASMHHSERDRVKGEEETTRWSPELLAALKQLRALLHRLFLSFITQNSIAASDREELNLFLALGYPILEEGPTGELVAIYHTVKPEVGAVLLPIALSALKLITEGERGRLHKCSNDRCVAIFYDTTRSATRQWCSPECMNRARSIRHYQRMKEARAASHLSE